MSKIIDSLSKAKELIKGLVTDKNTNEIASVVKALDEVESEAQTTEKELQTCKDKIVEMVKSTIVTKKAPEDENQVETPKTLDEIMEEEAKKIVQKDK